jgi:hypothetical protein
MCPRSTVEGPLGKMLKNCDPIRKVPLFSFKVSNPGYGYWVNPGAHVRDRITLEEG